MKTSSIGIELIKQFEGFCAKAYKCVSNEKYYTIGYGHYGADVGKNDTITKEKATELLKVDLAGFESKVNKYNDVYKWNQNEFDALVSFAYNIGNIDKLTANGTRTRAKIAECMLLYNKSGGTVLAGLMERRKKERELFLSAVSTSNYYNKYAGNSTNIDMVFKTIGVPDKYIGSWTSRKPIATANGINNYVGGLSQNIELMELAKKGKLKRA